MEVEEVPDNMIQQEEAVVAEVLKALEALNALEPEKPEALGELGRLVGKRPFSLPSAGTDDSEKVCNDKLTTIQVESARQHADQKVLTDAKTEAKQRLCGTS